MRITHKGFTLIELVMVIVLIAILAAFAMPKLNVTSTNAGAVTEKLRTDIRYAQNLAMTQNKRYRVYFNTSPAPAPAGYAVVNDANGDGTWGQAGEFAQDPAGGGDLSITLNAGQYAGITVGLTPAMGYIEFNSLGSPTVGGGVTVTVYGNSIAAGNIRVENQTGATN